ncbi:MAG TPA: ABC transporter substrate-binding protein [Xanthobacteraceae bacterium]|jgi:branched-chain amino acid transport system substrate-binding protein
MTAMRKLHLAVLPVYLLAIAGVRAEPGITETEIRVGMWTPLSGPVALLGQSARDAVRLWAKEVNDKGGIHGRKINFISYDDAASPQEAQAAVRRLIDQDQVFMLICGSVSGSTLPVRQVITREKVPFVSSISSNVNLMKPFSRYIFRIYANEDSQAVGIIDWIMEHEHIKRPALIYTSNDYGVGGFQVFSERLKEKYKITPAAAERYNQGDQDFSAQLLRIKSADPDGLLIYAFAQEAGIIVRQAKELGINAKLFGGGGTSTPLLQRGAGQAAVGFVSDLVVPEIADSSQSPAVVAYRDKLKANFYPDGFPPGRPSEYDLAGYAAGKVTEAALEKAGKDVSRESFVDALEGIKNFETGMTFPISYSKDNHEGTTQVEIIRVRPDLKWESISKIGGR